MNAGQCMPINSAISRRRQEQSLAPAAIVTRCLVAALLLLNFVEWSSGLRLTKMNAPKVADLHKEMELDCQFDMGVEELYAVKWYKDDQEFFRYKPDQKPDTVSFPVAGVHLVPNGTNCGQNRCKVQLRSLTRDHSGGAYRCEISSEAPTFRLASETQNITVAALPRENPKIEGLTKSYTEGDMVDAKCVSDPADPAPILSWFINGQQAPSKSVGEMTSSDRNGGLVARTIRLRFVAERKHSRGNRIELRCVSSLPGIPVDPQATTQIVPLRTLMDVAQDANNEKLHWPNSAAAATATATTLVMVIGVFTTVRWWSSSSIKCGRDDWR